MSAARRALTALGLVFLGTASVRADESTDLDLIPTQAPPASDASVAAAPDGSQRLYLENAFTLWSRRQTLVPSPGAQPDWEERLFFDARKQWRLAEDWRLFYSGRFNSRAEDTLPFPTHENIRHDFREGYVGWHALAADYLDLGRVNLKSGVAAGFNPTDFFKTRAVIEPLSVDPAVLREDRLGAMMLRGQHIGEGFAVTAAYAPKLEEPAPLATNTTLPSFAPAFDRTNAHHRLLLKGSADLGADIAPELLFYREGSATRWGADLTRSLGRSVVAYGEWSGGSAPSLIAQALSFGRETGTIPATAPNVLPASTASSFQNQLAAGFSYTTESRITLNLEYHFNQAGFSSTDWSRWFRIGTAPPRLPGVANELWLIREFAIEQQEPISQHSIFLRADWVDAFIPKLELTALANIDLVAASSFVQVTADYYLSEHWTVGALATASLGGPRSNYGSLPGAATAILKLARYF